MKFLEGLGFSGLVICTMLASPAWGWGQKGTEKQAFFGELHLHTALSTDAFMNGTRKHPFTAYRFAQGDPVMLQSGETWSLPLPLDFVAVTDHAESFGDLRLCTTPGSSAYKTKLCQGMRGRDPMLMGRVIGGWAVDKATRNPEVCGEDGQRCIDAARETWNVIREAANRANRPGEFTALVGYEYSPVILSKMQTSKVHRNIIYRGDDVPDRAFSSYDGTIEDLHAWLDEECVEPCRAITIPHNSNASSSRIFWEGKNSDGTPWSQEILERRARLEPLVEIYQGKGSSECHLGLGLTDEECGFEQWVRNCGPSEQLGCSTTSDMVRDTIVRGLRIEDERGINPFKLGFIGSTDSHLGTPGATIESDYQGQLGYPDSTPEHRVGDVPSVFGMDSAEDGGWGFLGPSKFSPGGLAGVWAEENTREGIWDALARREAFSTSGTRIRVRFFGSFDFPEQLHEQRNAFALGDQKGVPMGGDLKASPKGEAPQFLVWATRDTQSAPLQKIQIVKGWVEDGAERSEVYDVACSDDNVPDPATNRCPDNGARVDTTSCAITTGPGDADLATTWTDPNFNPEARAVYYARVLENPVCRWSTHDAHRIGAPLPKHVPPTIKERAWTSPIWYTP